MKQIAENGLYLVLDTSPDTPVCLLHLGTAPLAGLSPEKAEPVRRLVEVQLTGLDPKEHHGRKHTGSAPGGALRFVAFRESRNHLGLKLAVEQRWEGLLVISHIQFFDGVPVIRCHTELQNDGQDTYALEYVTSFALTGLSKESPEPRDEGARFHIPHSTWYGEAQWKSYTPKMLGYDVVNEASFKRIALTATGSWPSAEYLPMGSYENTATGETMTWQIEASGSWHWEVSDTAGQLYLHLSGPTWQENQFLKLIAPGQSFASEPCAVAVTAGGFEASIQALTRYRRRIRRLNADNAAPKVIFNDYMNCLMGDPTTEALYPLIDAAAACGCEIFCIDCGWYDDGPWWDGVGAWLPSARRFPGGIEKPLKRIREAGMIPGLWLELEVMGVKCPLVQQVPKDWFFQRHGHPVIYASRYQLDYRHPAVREHADQVVRRLVEDYGVGYIKMDYNIDIGPGTDLRADSPGDGLLGHTRAYLEWLDSIWEKYPDLIIENCGSGGMRMTYSLLSRHSIQSVTDQTDYVKMAAIAANCMTAVTPEQAAVWSYPLREGDLEEVAFNMVNAMLLRVHQSGHLAELSPKRRALVTEGIVLHKAIAGELAKGVPFWPLGQATFSDAYVSVGVDCGPVKYVAVWRTGDASDEIALPVGCAVGFQTVKVVYPSTLPTTFNWNPADGILTVRLAPKTARLFKLDKS